MKYEIGTGFQDVKLWFKNNSLSSRYIVHAENIIYRKFILRNRECLQDIMVTLPKKACPSPTRRSSIPILSLAVSIAPGSRPIVPVPKTLL